MPGPAAAAFICRLEVSEVTAVVGHFLATRMTRSVRLPPKAEPRKVSAFDPTLTLAACLFPTRLPRLASPSD